MNTSGKNFIICRVTLRLNQLNLGRVHHTVHGRPIGNPSELMIVKFGDDPGFYLIRCTGDGDELADTYHASHTEAMDQARFEYSVEYADWMYPE